MGVVVDHVSFHNFAFVFFFAANVRVVFAGAVFVRLHFRASFAFLITARTIRTTIALPGWTIAVWIGATAAVSFFHFDEALEIKINFDKVFVLFDHIKEHTPTVSF